ncbi:MAG: hypothetical protein HGA96_05800 [Desulfobulbaceae bacterium]|nr:hypothetical protein [Desulfobulbaceae bacterium]
MLFEKNLGNGLSFTLADQSRPIAADRWYVKVVGVISLIPSEADWDGIAETNPALLARVRRHLGTALAHQLVKDRNFVDAAVKEEVVQEQVAQLLATIGGYLEVEAFPARFLARKYQEAREICRLAMVQEEAVRHTLAEPVDFSHCFK